MNDKLLEPKYCKKCRAGIGTHYTLVDYCGKCDKENEEKHQKHEEIKRMAEKFYPDFLILSRRETQHQRETSSCVCERGDGLIFDEAWESAEIFYKLAKEKEGETNV